MKPTKHQYSHEQYAKSNIYFQMGPVPQREYCFNIPESISAFGHIKRLNKEKCYDQLNRHRHLMKFKSEYAENALNQSHQVYQKQLGQREGQACRDQGPVPISHKLPSTSRLLGP